MMILRIKLPAALSLAVRALPSNEKRIIISKKIQ
jgi:hypothetical protein